MGKDKITVSLGTEYKFDVEALDEGPDIIEELAMNTMNEMKAFLTMSNAE